MRHVEFTRPARTATGRARNAGEAAQQLAHLTRERLRIGQERKALVARIQKIDDRLGAIAAFEEKLLPMVRKEADRARGAQTPPPPRPPAPPLPAAPPSPQLSAAPPAPPVRRHAVLPIGMSEVTLQY